MEDYQVNGSCSMNVRNKECMNSFWLEELKGREVFGDVYIHGK
jgi:hypothetical protein